MTQEELNRIKELHSKIKDKTITQKEKDEFVEIFYNNNEINDIAYNAYKEKKFADSVIRTCITIGGIILTDILLNKIIENNNK
ncbi:MAG: hypothetical protein LBG80_19145 [Bacteroidales bacterium]|jgi:hypothetical protein|nr:hypothetical protein [Bacteroidales bacterium]